MITKTRINKNKRHSTGGTKRNEDCFRREAHSARYLKSVQTIYQSAIEKQSNNRNCYSVLSNFSFLAMTSEAFAENMT